MPATDERGSAHPVPAPLETELAAEQAHLETSRLALRRMRDRAQSLFATGDKVAGDAYTAEQLGRHLARRVAELADDPATALFFGRLDFGPADPEHAGRAYHVGRRHVTDERGEPLVLDWRAWCPARSTGPAPATRRGSPYDDGSGSAPGR